MKRGMTAALDGRCSPCFAVAAPASAAKQGGTFQGACSRRTSTSSTRPLRTTRTPCAPERDRREPRALRRRRGLGRARLVPEVRGLPARLGGRADPTGSRGLPRASVLERQESGYRAELRVVDQPRAAAAAGLARRDVPLRRRERAGCARRQGVVGLGRTRARRRLGAADLADAALAGPADAARPPVLPGDRHGDGRRAEGREGAVASAGPYYSPRGRPTSPILKRNPDYKRNPLATRPATSTRSTTRPT